MSYVRCSCVGTGTHGAACFTALAEYHQTGAGQRTRRDRHPAHLLVASPAPCSFRRASEHGALGEQTVRLTDAISLGQGTCAQATSLSAQSSGNM